MSAYGEFARVYDAFMEDVPYERWANFIVERLAAAGIRDGLVLDLGCGTGRMTRLLSDAGFDMIGIDSSPDMLVAARENTSDEGILYLCQDMREFELYGTVGAIVCVCDGMNYMASEEELCRVFSLAENYLDYGGVFIFDMLTPYYYREILADNTFAGNRDDASYIWENEFDSALGENRCSLTLYVREGEAFQRYSEQHFQYAYEPVRVAGLLKECGLHNIEMMDEAGICRGSRDGGNSKDDKDSWDGQYGGEKASGADAGCGCGISNETQRVIFICRKRTK